MHSCSNRYLRKPNLTKKDGSVDIWIKYDIDRWIRAFPGLIVYPTKIMAECGESGKLAWYLTVCTYVSSTFVPG